MASTTALITGFTGILANSQMINVVGNNISNGNTTAYKSTRLMFESAFNRNYGMGTAPTATTGGSNPNQVGLGVKSAGTQRDFNDGVLSSTGVSTDLAIDGNGFFVVDNSGGQFYTRAGAFDIDAENNLVTIDGSRVQGYGIDDNFTVTQDTLSDISIPVGSMTIAEATTNVIFSGNLNASGDPGVLGSRTTLEALQVLGTASPPPGNPPYADATTRLVDIDDGTGTAMFTSGDSIKVSGAEKGGKPIPSAELSISTTTTIDDYMTYLERILGIDTSVSTDPGGVTLDDTTGVITIEGNYGTVNNLDISSADISRLDSTGTVLGQPFTTTKSQTADGESVRTTFAVYDSLGTPLNVDITLVLDSKDDTGLTWRYFVESGDNTGLDLALSTGTLSFDTNGQIIEPSDIDITIGRESTGAQDPLQVNLDFGSSANNVSSLTDTDSNIAAIFQDGSPFGTLNEFSFSDNGIINGIFTNGVIRSIGQIAIATFTNNEGLVESGNNQYSAGPNSGDPVINAPMIMGAGRIVEGSLELSNVDLSQEFINLILASTGYSASGRVINTANDLIQQLLLIAR